MCSMPSSGSALLTARPCGRRGPFFLYAVVVWLAVIGPSVRVDAGVVATAPVGSTDGTPLPIFVDLSSKDLDLPTYLAALICTGLYNRGDAPGPGVYTLAKQQPGWPPNPTRRDRHHPSLPAPQETGKNTTDDEFWMQALLKVDKPDVLGPDAFMRQCTGSGVPKGYIRYSFKDQQMVVPQLITVAGVLDAVLLEDGAAHGQLDMVFDAVTEWKGFTALDATSYIYDKYVDQTSGLSKMNPGLDTSKHWWNPKLDQAPTLGFTDFIVKEKLFNMYLNNGCIPLTKDHAMMEKIATRNPWPKPVRVYGYDDTWNAGGGYLFEAETSCVKEHNMGQVATLGVNNLSFFSRAPPITIDAPLVQNPEPVAVFNSSRTYVALVLGDGDNVAFMKGPRKDWFNERLRRCTASPESDCFPLLWTASPHLPHLAPDMIRWYYAQARLTKGDYFVLPPSGDIYSYPGEMSAADQAAFVANTERDATIMSTCASVAWEMFTHWGRSIKKYFPKYAVNNIVRGFFAVNVPFMLPVWEFGRDFYKVLDDRIVLFRPREWRGTGKTTIPFGQKSYLTADAMAAEINAYPGGTVTALYLTSDGGGGIGDIFDMVHKLGDHVEVVGFKSAVELALQGHRAKQNVV